MVVLPTGRFTLGSPPEERWRTPHEGPETDIRILAPFAISVREVTVAEYAQFIADSGYRPQRGCTVWEFEAIWRPNADWQSPGFPQDSTHPVTCVSWRDAWAYTAWLSARTNKLYRLPSEAEWSYAVRAGVDLPQAWGADPADQCRHANGADRVTPWPRLAPCTDGYVQTSPVGRFAANAFGLHDTLGNVDEWTLDCWSPSHVGASTDSRARNDGDCTRRVYRGGNWRSGPDTLRFAARSKAKSDTRMNLLGFRVVRQFWLEQEEATTTTETASRWTRTTD